MSVLNRSLFRYPYAFLISPWILLFSPSMGPLVNRCTKKVRILPRRVLHIRATFLTGSNRLRMAQPYLHFLKYFSGRFDPGA